MRKVPTIKGIFVNSHIKALREVKGEEGLAKLQKNCAGLLDFKNSDDVPVRDETRILECAVQIVYSDRSLSQEEVEYEAGRLHFKNFITTPLARIMFPLFKTQFKGVMLGSGNIAAHVFKGVKFSSKELGKKTVKVTMGNTDYPLLHFKGFFQEWIYFSELDGRVEAQDLGKNVYAYTMKWN